MTVDLAPPVDRIIRRGPIDKAIKAGTEPELMRFGAFTRRRAQTSLRYRLKASEPGKPPSVHRSKRFTRVHKSKKHGNVRRPTSPLRELIAFAIVHPATHSTKVIIGPMIFPRGKPVPGLVPRRLELGGSGTFLADGEVKAGFWEARPYMGPAFRAELGKVPGIFAGSVRG